MPELNQNHENLDHTNHGDISAIIIIDKYKLPEELRNKLPQDLQDRLLELLQEDLQKDSSKIIDDNKKLGNLFTIQTGSVVGNIYKDGINKTNGI